MCEPTEEELDKLKKYIGKKLTINIQADEFSWGYGERTENKYDINYIINLEDVAADRITGTILEDAENWWKRKTYHKSTLITEPFSLCEIGQNQETQRIKRIVLIQNDNNILYDRRV